MTTDEVFTIQLDAEEWDLLQCERLEALLRPSYDFANVVIDMTQVTFIDSTCLQKLINMHRERVKKRELPACHFAITSPNVNRLFTMVHFDEVWPIFETVSEARDSFLPSK